MSATNDGVAAFPRIGEMTEAPVIGSPHINPSLKKGDSFVSFCHIQGGGGWWCGPYTVKYLLGNQPAYRAKWGKVDKVASTWMLRARTAGGKEDGV